MAEDFKKFQKRLHRRLPEQMKAVWQDYLAFCQCPVPDDAKAFSAHQQACKNALAHLLILMKLGAFPETEADPSAQENEWIQAARAAIAETEEKEDDC